MRKYLFYKILLCSLALSIICSCGTVTVVQTGSDFYEPTNPNYVRILKTIPDRKYVELGPVIASNFYSSAFADMYNEIKTKAAVLGADAVILTDEGFIKKEHTYPQYWATGVAVKFE